MCVCVCVCVFQFSKCQFSSKIYNVMVREANYHCKALQVTILLTPLLTKAVDVEMADQLRQRMLKKQIM